MNQGLDSAPFPRISDRAVPTMSTDNSLPELQGSASDARAAISRQQYSDFLRRFNPVRMKLAGMYDNPMLRQESLSQAGAMVRDSFDRLPEQRERYLSGLGLEMGEQEQASMQRQDNLAESLADVTARNRAQRAFDDRNEQIAVGLNPGRIAGG